MKQDEKTEIISHYVQETLEKLEEMYSGEIATSLKVDYSKGEIVIKVKE